MALFTRFLRQAQISILEILYIFLWLKFSPSLNSNKNYTFSKVSKPEQNSGFTLIELTVVISLISIMLFFAVPRFRNAVLTDNVNNTSRWIIGKVRVLKEYSASKQKLCILHVNMDSNKMWVSDETMEEEDLQKAHEKGFEIPEDVKVINVEYPQKGIISAGQVDICFYRAGYSDKALIHIQGYDERKISFLIEPFLPKVKLYEKYVDFEDS